MAIHALTTPMPAAHPGSLRARREHAVEQMLAAAERLMAELDAMDGDPDLEEQHDREAVSEDEGADCDDDGWDSDSELETAGTPILAWNGQKTDRVLSPFGSR